MNNTTPQLSPEEFGKVTSESEAIPELEPGAGEGATVEGQEVLIPDMEPPTTVEEGVEVPPRIIEEETELAAPEFSPADAGVFEVEAEEIIAPEEPPLPG